MTDEVKSLLSKTEELMKGAIVHLELELNKIRAGKANPAMLENVQVDYYGSRVPISNVASVSTPDPRTIMLQPWEKAMITPIEKAIQAANLGFNPQNDGILIRITVPPLTEERRKELVKKCNAEGEQGKIAIRNIRRDAIEHIKKLQKDGLSEDAAKDAEAAIQDTTNRYIAMVEKHLAAKDKEIMAV